MRWMAKHGKTTPQQVCWRAVAHSVCSLALLCAGLRSSLGLEGVTAGEETAQVEASSLGFGPGGSNHGIGTFLAGDGEELVLGVESAAFLAEGEVGGGDVVVILGLADAVEFADDRLLGQVEYLDFLLLVVEDGQGDGEFDRFGSGAFAVEAAGEIAHLGGDLFGGGFSHEPERLGFAVKAFAPALVILDGFVGEKGEADRRTSGDLAGVQVAAGRPGNGGLGVLGKEGHKRVWRGLGGAGSGGA